MPWSVFGDFNEILFQREMIGSGIRSQHQMRNFRNSLQDCGLHDLGFVGERFTFSNKRRGTAETKVRLDRAVVNRDWKRIFPDANLRVGFANASDHCPIILSTDAAKTHESRPVQSFRFEPMWLRDNTFNDKVKEAWESSKMDGGTLSEVLQRCGRELDKWNKDKFGNVQKHIKSLKSQLEANSRKERTDQSIRTDQRISGELDEWFAREELLWKQRARLDWLKQGEQNMIFFKIKATNRKVRKMISKIESVNGRVVDSQEDIQLAFTNYFQELFSSQVDTGGVQWEEVMDNILPRVTPEMNASLEEPYTLEEIKKAAFELHPDKAPGPDDFSALFYQKYWNLVKGETCKEILNALNSGFINHSLNATQIILIPKIKEPLRVHDFRPISLCNVGMKIITKAIGNRLKNILQVIISRFQSAFLKGRIITDNIIIAQELAHTIRQKKKGQNGFLCKD